MIEDPTGQEAVTRSYLRIPGLPDRDLEVPYIEIRGREAGPRLTVLAGVHGCEYVGMAALREFVAEVNPAKLSGVITAVPVVNLPAYTSRTPFVVPADGKNLNRCFPGDTKGTYSDVLAHHVFERFIRGADYLIDLHSGDVPETIEPLVVYDESPVSEAARQMAVAYGIQHVIKQPAAGRVTAGTTSSSAADVGVPAITAEAGGNGILDRQAIATHVRGLRNVAATLGMLPYEVEQAPRQIEHDHGWNWIHTPVGGWWEPLVELGKRAEKGDVLGRVSDLFGDVIHEVKAPEAGILMLITTSPAVAADGLLTILTREVAE
ncbi:succinylglutamate desuccinylase [Arthrobacter sp. CDRTa11]|uniref:succinylglutamate desuccinylase/aspartoacylase family protein n=1 Tax=Arthrobacter sp. CDRTa11 TaxID=2651199 RepID=UPI002265D673|nr:succinylglutamate desuccinylase/aspartoacylase family protein [Arthrobacter sp. CDRTa11]UZX04666.1 succinylglutamate desuccinylase [Arthrobacter sp. CDRTa11]